MSPMSTKPGKSFNAALKVISYNVRGLKDENKLRHLLNGFYKRNGGKNRDFMACLQETYLENEGKIPYLWRGNFHLTPGIGSSCGCLTLLSAHVNIIGSQNIGNREHVLALQKTGEMNISYIVANVYAPNPNSNEKLEFCVKVFDTISEFEEKYNCAKIIIMGDFNLNFDEKEIKNLYIR